MKAYFIIKRKGAPDSEAWEEYADVESKETAEEEVKALVAKFNRVETKRYGKKAVLRELVRMGRKSEPKKKKSKQAQLKVWFMDIYPDMNKQFRKTVRSWGLPIKLTCFENAFDAWEYDKEVPDFIIIDLAAMTDPAGLGHDPVQIYASFVDRFLEKFSSANIAMFSAMDHAAKDYVEEIKEELDRPDIKYLSFSNLDENIREYIVAYSGLENESSNTL